MRARQIILFIISLIILAGAYGAQKALMGAKKPQPRQEAGSSTKLVNTVKVVNGDVQSVIAVTGKLVAERRMELFAEVTGTLLSQQKVFKEGNTFAKGDILLRIDASEFRMSIVSQKSALLNSFTQLLPDLRLDFPDSYEKWTSYLKNFDIEGSLQSLPEITDEKEKYFLASRNILGQYYNIKSQEERLSKYSIKAAFDGIVTQSMIDPGTTVRAGQKLGEFIDPDTYELEVAVPLKDVGMLSLGDEVALISPDVLGSWNGKVKRISKKIDEATQTVRVFVGVSGQGLREGMYLAGKVESELIPNAMQIARKLLIDGKVYLVTKDGLQQHKVEVVKYGEGTAIVQGLPDGADLLVDNLIGAYNGMPVQKIVSK